MGIHTKIETFETQPLVSIITPVLNGEKEIEKTIQSILSQTYKNIEYIIIDGGSKDKTVEVVRRYESKISSWISEPDEGIADAFNKGIKRSSGDIIGISNAGDRYTSKAVEYVVEAFSDQKNAGYNFTFGDLICVDENDNQLFTWRGDRNYQRQIRYTMPTVNHPTVFVKKSMYEKCGLFNISYRYAMDYDFLLRGTRIGMKGLYIEKVLVRMALMGISRTQFFQSYKDICVASIKHGYSPVRAYLRLYLKGARGIIRLSLEKLGLENINMVLRRAFLNIH